MLGTELITRIRFVMNDTTATYRTADADMVPFINDGILYIGTQRPDAISLSTSVALAAGSKQSLSSFSTPGTKMLDVYRCGTRAVRLTDRDALDSNDPSWHAMAQTSAVTNWCYDERDPLTFWVYPPASAGTTLDVNYVRVPPQVTTGTLGAALPMADAYNDALINYVLSRLYSRETEDDFNVQLAMSYRQACDAFVGAKTRADLVFSPDLNKAGGAVNKSAAVGGI